MTVEELIQHLKQFNHRLEVVICEDQHFGGYESASLPKGVVLDNTVGLKKYDDDKLYEAPSGQSTAKVYLALN